MVHHISRIPINKAGGTTGATVFIFGDRQQGSQGYRAEAWAEFKREFRATQNAWAIGLGDYGDFLRPSMRTPMLNAMQKDDSARSMLERDILKGHDQIIDDMEFLKGRLIGIHAGHHLWPLMSGINTDQRLASALKAPYLGWIASTRLVFEVGNKTEKKHSPSSHVHMLLSTHGNANGRKVHSALAYLENNYVSAWSADSFAMGHGCKSGNHVPFKRNNLRRTGPPGVDVQIPRCMVVGGFAEGYTDGWHSDYVEQAGFTPQPMGYGLFRFKIVRRIGLHQLHSTGARSNTLLVEPVNRVLDL